MNTKGLSLNSIPPILIPLRFFLTAPLFGVLASLLFLYYGADIWTSRWNPSSLALTHLLTIGFMLMVMMGALYQFIPVMIGQLIPGCKQLVPIIHPLLILGTVSLAVAFLSFKPWLYWLAFCALGIAIGIFAFSLIPLLVSSLKNHLIVFLVRVLYLILIITIGLGLYMLLAYSSPQLGIGFRTYTNLHALWGLIGLVVILIMAISSQVIPMFFVSPEFSVAYLKGLSLTIIMTLILYSLLSDNSQLVIELLLTAELIFFAFYSLSLMYQRKRKLPDVTIKFFYLSMISLLITLLFWWGARGISDTFVGQFRGKFEFTLAILLIYGLALSAIIGMLQKIVPFLIFLHLQKLSMKHPGSMALIPNMKMIIKNQHSRIQLALHLFSLILLLTSVYFPVIIWLSGLVMLGNFIWLSYCMFSGFALFRKNKSQILTFPEMKMNP